MNTGYTFFFFSAKSTNIYWKTTSFFQIIGVSKTTPYKNVHIPLLFITFCSNYKDKALKCQPDF